MSHATRRVVTGHDDNGKAIIESDGAAPNVRVREGAGFVSTLLWVTDETPANVGLRIDRADRTIAVAPPANGSILRIVDFPPVTPELRARRAGMPTCTAPGASTTPSSCPARSTCCWTIPKFISRPAIS